MDNLSQAAVLFGTLAIVCVVAGLAYFVNWAGPSYAAGVISGGAFFLCWYRLRYGHWP